MWLSDDRESFLPISCVVGVSSVNASVGELTTKSAR